MARPTDFPQSNVRWFGEGDVGDLPAFRDPQSGENISCWELSAEEIAAILETGKVYLHVWGQHPAVYVSGKTPFIEQVEVEYARD